MKNRWCIHNRVIINILDKLEICIPNPENIIDRRKKLQGQRKGSRIFFF